MNKIIRRVEISGFRSLDSVQIVCDEVNVFTGLNDVGKSNVLRALNLFFTGETDPGQSIDFSADYSKLSLAKAQKSSKKKQQIKMRIYFNPPSSFKSLQDEELWVERTYDRFGKLSEKSSLDETPKRASLTRLINSIRYYYIPALKGPSVLEYILGEIGKRNLMSSGDIIELNQKVNDNLKDFASILASSSINIKTNFELPVLVQDFWQRLNINTEFDEFTSLNDDAITPSTKGKGIKLREEAYQISLVARGEGLKSKYIPPLLKWIQEHEPSKHFVWGIDEPENSLEFKKAQEVADLYFNEYPRSTQILLTSHSLAFIFPTRTKRSVTVFRCIKTGHGDIEIRPLDDLFIERSRIEIAEELGALEIQKDVVEEWRKKDNESRQIADKFNKLIKPLLLVEGSIDKDYLDQTIRIFDCIDDYKVEIRPVGYLELGGNERSGGHTWLDRVWHLRHQFPDDKFIALLYDVDCNKEPNKDGNMSIYCPARMSDQVYEKGIEHLLIFPDDYRKEDYIITLEEGDVTKSIPDKQKIKNYLFGLTEEDQRICFQNLYNLLQQIEGDCAV